MRKTKKNNNE